VTARRLALLLALVATAAPLAAQGPQRDRLSLVLRDHQSRGLPVDPLRAKLAEGRAKGASEERIVAAVTLLAARMDTVARALRPTVSDAELREGADALAASATPAMLARLRARAPHESLEPALIVLTRLLRRGVPRDAAERAVVRLLDRRLERGTMLATADALVRDLAGGARLDDALDARLGQGRVPGGLPRAIDAAATGAIGAGGVPTISTGGTPMSGSAGNGPTLPPPAPRRP
jgi:hypothetical protein